MNTAIPPRRKWVPEHRRAPARVAAHTRANGVQVRAHVRQGAAVKGHYAAVCANPAPPAPRRSIWAPRRTSATRTPDAVVVIAPTPNNCAAAAAINALPGCRTAPRPTKRHSDCQQARLTDVIWRDAAGQIHRAGAIAAGMGLIRIAESPSQITLEIALGQRRYRVDSAFLINDNCEAVTVPDAALPPELINRAVDRVAPRTETPHQRAARRNRVRAALGHSQPEQAVYHAVNDILAAQPLPALPIIQSVEIDLPGLPYRITISAVENQNGRPQ